MKTINTKRLVLRKLKDGDAVSMFSNYCGDEKVTKYLTWTAHTTALSTEKLLEIWLAEYEGDDCYRWAITTADDTDNVIGTIDVVALDKSTSSAEIGYCIGKGYWGTGIMSEAFSAVIDYLFSERLLKRIHARHDTLNIASGKVMQKCGLSFEGVIRQSSRNNRGIVDMAVYSILRSEYNR